MLGDKLTLPPKPHDFLQLQYSQTDRLELEEPDFQVGCTYPFAVDSPFLARIIRARQLTRGEDVKKVIEIRLNVEESSVEFQPGDTIGVIPQNCEEEVEEILKQLKLTEKVDNVVTVSVKQDTLKKKASVPPHISSKTTLRHIFKSCLDIRAVPKKVFLRVLALYTEDSNERRRLEELCSKEGSADYSQHIVEARTTLLDLLTMFPSCCPPVERILEHLPRLQARPYSIASSPLKANKELDIVFSVLELPSLKSKQKFCHGVCTGWMDSLTSCIQTTEFISEAVLEEKISNLTLKDGPSDLKIPIYFRKSAGFTLPNDPTLPLILIGPGTGIAPFIGFLEHRTLERTNSTNYGEVWLFFGCRYENKDFLYRTELEKFIEDGVLTRLFLSFSRGKQKEKKPKYVQDNISLYGKDFINQVFEKNATIFICGDAKNMGKDVIEAIVKEIQKHKGTEKEEARSLVRELQNQGRLLQDIWV